MKAITIMQPWASLIACGAKRIETRSWATKYRGPIAIHAGKSMKEIGLQIFREPFYSSLQKSTGPSRFHELEKMISFPPFGSVVAIADLIACEEMTMDKIVLWKDVYGKEEIEFGDFQPGRYAWILDNVRPIEPVPAKGQQRIWEWEER